MKCLLNIVSGAILARIRAKLGVSQILGALITSGRRGLIFPDLLVLEGGRMAGIFLILSHLFFRAGRVRAMWALWKVPQHR